MSKPLEGFRILDFTQFMSGPMCTLFLSDFGAEVIKIENPPLGDATRYGAIVDNGVSGHFATRNRGKKSIVMNMKDEKQKELFLELLKTADAVVENYKPGTMEKFGLSFEKMQEVNPKIVLTSISGYGQEGPYASHGAFDQTIQAESGVMSVTGFPGTDPVKCGVPIADYCGGLCGCIGTLMAMLEAQRTGHGRHVDVSMMDAMIFCLENSMTTYLRNGVIPEQTGNGYASSAPIGAYKCRDGVPLMISVSTDSLWQSFCRAVDRPDWAADESLATMTQRANRRAEVDAMVAELFSHYDSEELARRMQEAKMVYGKVNNLAAVAEHPQVAFRKTMVNASYPNGVSFTVPGSPILMSGMERQMEYEAVPLGYNTIEVLKEVADEDKVHEIFDPVLKNVEETIKTRYGK